MIDNTPIWDEADGLLYKSHLTMQGCHWGAVMHPEIYENARRQSILQIVYTVILARLIERFGRIAGWRIWQRWLERKSDLKVDISKENS